MEKLTKALMTDETGQEIVTKLTALSGQMHELAMATRGSAILFESASDISVLGDGGYLAVYVGTTNPLVISGWTGDNSLVTGHLYYLIKSGTTVTSRDLGEYGGTAVTDTTLSISGAPADAKAVGDALADFTIEVDDTLSEQGKAADAKAVGDALALKANTSSVTALETTVNTKASTSSVTALEQRVSTLENDSGDSELSTTAKTLLIAILRATAQVSDQSSNISALEQELSGGGAPVVYRSITWSGSHYSHSNSSTIIANGNSFTSTIVADSGYSIDSVVVTMGGTVISGAYSGGTVTIASVTGDVSIAVVTSQIAPVVTTYTVTNNLTNCTTSNNAVSVNEGSSYSATITANSGYTLDSVTCTMGGVSQTVTNGVISIASVTGNIVVTASATENVQPGDSAIYNWDFTQSLTDSVSGRTAETNATQNSNGITFSGLGKYVFLGDMTSITNKTFEIDVTSIGTAVNVNQHRRLFTNCASNGSGDVNDASIMYFSGRWNLSTGSTRTAITYGDDVNMFDGKTVKIYIDSSKYVKISYKTIGADDSTYTVFGTYSSPIETSVTGVSIGSKYNYDSIGAAVIRGVRVYEGEK